MKNLTIPIDHLVMLAELDVHRCACQVDEHGTTILTQHLLQQTIQHNMGARIDYHSSLMLRSKPLDLTG